MSDATFIIFLLAILFVIGVVLYVPLRWLAMRSVKPEDVPPDKLDPKRTHLTCLEVFALVLPLSFAIASPIVGYALVRWVMPDGQQLSDLMSLMFLASTVLLAIIGFNIGQALSRILLQRSRYSARWHEDQ